MQFFLQILNVFTISSILNSKQSLHFCNISNQYNVHYSKYVMKILTIFDYTNHKVLYYIKGDKSIETCYSYLPQLDTMLLFRWLITKLSFWTSKFLLKRMTNPPKIMISRILKTRLGIPFYRTKRASKLWVFHMSHFHLTIALHKAKKLGQTAS